MLEKNQIEKIKETVEEFFGKMTISISGIEVSLSAAKNDARDSQEAPDRDRDVVDLDIKTDEPQILIGTQGQTLFEIQRLLRTILNKKLQKVFYFNLDINDYKKTKVEYLKNIAKDLADQVAKTKEEKVLSPMSSYERRIIHAELAQRTDVITESQGDSYERHIVIKPK